MKNTKPPIAARLGSSHFDVGGIVCSAAWSSEGKFLATATELNPAEGKVRVSLWNAQTGQRIWQHDSPSPQRNPLQFSKDGKVVFERGEFGRLAFDVATGKPIDQKPRGESSADGTVRVFRGKQKSQLVVERDGTENQPITISTKDEKVTFTSFRISLGGRLLAVGNSKKEWGLWDTRDGRWLCNLDIPKADNTVVEFTPDGKQLVASGNWQGIYVLKTETGKIQRILRTSGGSDALAIDAEGKRLASAARFGETAQIWNIQSGQKLRVIQAPRFEVRAMAFSPDGTRIALAGRMGSQNGPLGIWDLASGKETLEMIGHVLPVTKAAFSFDGQLIATTSSDRAICIWEVKTTHLLRKLEGDANGDLRFSPDGWMLAAAGPRGDYRIWEVSSGELLVESGPIPNVSSSAQCRFSPELDRLAVGSNQGQVHLIETSTGNHLPSINGFDKHEVGALAFSGDGRWLAVAAGRVRVPHPARGHVVLWDLAQNKKLHELKSPHPVDERSYFQFFEALEFSHDNRTLAARHSELGIEFWNTREGTRMEGVLNQAGKPMAFWPLGQVLVLLSPPGSRLGESEFSHVELMEVATGGIFQRWDVSNRATTFAISPNGELLALASRDSRQVLLLDIRRPFMEEPPTELALKDAVGLLTDHDAPKGRNAMATLIAGGDRSLPLLASHLEFESQPDGLDPRIQQLIRDLDSDHFFTREKATKELAALGARAVPALKSALEQNPSLEAGLRIRMALRDSSNTPRRLAGPSLRRIRILEILDRTGTAKAKELLDSLAKDSKPTLEAGPRRIEPSQANP